MLIRFTVENFLSFNQRVDFNLLASEEENHPHHVVNFSQAQSRKILRTSIIYGANASGKSNLIKAMSFAQKMIVEGIEKSQNIPLIPFRLNESNYNKPSRFEFEFYVANKAYAYGFILNKQRVVEEWLFDINQTEEVSIFERREQLIGFDYKHPLFENISEEDKQRLEFEAKGTRANLLFLTNCAERNIKRFHLFYHWFQEKLSIIFPHSENLLLHLLSSMDNDFFNQTLRFFDFGISELHFEPLALEKDREMPYQIKEKIKSSFPYGSGQVQFISYSDCNYLIKESSEYILDAFKIFTVRTNAENKKILFELFEESDGTRRIINLMPILMRLRENDTTIIIDELERSLHALLSYKLFELVLNHGAFNSHHSQLIATTHEVNLLDIKQLFRKDEIWFVEKDNLQQSMLYSMTDAAVEELNVVNGYLKGRFGGIPFIADIETLGWKV
ncbi:AAA family ATPase [Thioflexithrix psekupsensis]|uniref:ATPase AAA-type core domain-containing protein n=1 Tax=Thioflexithrix psekupsensis TaxID=1570016 RepID=A0A251X8S2_9GAMM|nr:ATP-binding protein [Thioflexithrix psekupsensis]OUD14396.1 hypothetical protein TPSD3_08775 [Thioflexithrix psekupsensis]